MIPREHLRRRAIRSATFRVFLPEGEAAHREETGAVQGVTAWAAVVGQSPVVLRGFGPQGNKDITRVLCSEVKADCPGDLITLRVCKCSNRHVVMLW